MTSREGAFSALRVYDVSQNNCPLIQEIHVTAVKRVGTDKRGAPCARMLENGIIVAFPATNVRIPLDSRQIHSRGHSETKTIVPGKLKAAFVNI